MRSSASIAAFALLLSVSALGTATGREGPCTVTENEVSLVNCGAIPQASGKRRVRTQSDCDQDLRVEIQDVPRGDYTVRVDGVDRGTITVRGRREGQNEFDSSPKGRELLLDFDPFGDIDILQGSVVILSLGQCLL